MRSPPPPVHRSAFVVLLASVVAAMLGACGVTLRPVGSGTATVTTTAAGDDVSGVVSPGVATAPPAPTPASDPADPAVAPVSLPEGRVADVMVGRWSGGEGKSTGEYLLIDRVGHFARGKDGEQAYSRGVIVASRDGTMTAYDIDGGSLPGGWEYVDAGGGIEVLTLHFGSHPYAYVRV
jgi:hypothetical protein